MFADCDTCVNLDTYLCDECVHNQELKDHYKKAGPEVIAERRKKEFLLMEEKLPHSFVKVEVSSEFREFFAKLKEGFSGLTNFSANCAPIHASDGSLSASNGYILAKIFCDVPEELRRKNIIRLENGRARIFNGTLPWQDREENIVNHRQNVILSGVPLEVQNETVRLKLPEGDICLKKSNYDKVAGLLTGKIVLYYSKVQEPVLFEGDNGFAIVAPLRN